MTSPSEPARDTDPPQRVSTLELFFDLVFVFTITQLTSSLARHVTRAAAGRLLLIFGVLWWMYGGYAWLTNARTPSRAPERLLLLVGMAGFLVIGLSIPHAFGGAGARGRDGLALGLGYLVVVCVHSVLYLRVNRAGDVGFRHTLGIGPPRYRALAAALGLAAWPLSVTVDAAAKIALLTAVTAVALAAESRAARATVEA